MSEAKINLSYREKKQLYEREFLCCGGRDYPYNRRYINYWKTNTQLKPQKIAE
jgi:hypothetical protein